MPKKSRHRSDALRSVHETVLVDKTTMHRFDLSCLTKLEILTPKEIAAIRERAGVSQGVFARYLNVPTSLVSQWERGERHPTGAAIKLLSLVKHKGLGAIA